MKAYIEKLSEKGLLAIAIVLSSVWLAAVPVIYLLLREWRKKHKNEPEKQDLGGTREGEDSLPTGTNSKRSSEKSL